MRKYSHRNNKTNVLPRLHREPESILNIDYLKSYRELDRSLLDAIKIIDCIRKSKTRM